MTRPRFGGMELIIEMRCLHFGRNAKIVSLLPRDFSSEGRALLPIFTVHDSSAAVMAHSSRLSTFLRERVAKGRAAKFVIGEWLHSLHPADLADLIRLGENVVLGLPPLGESETRSTDFLMVGVIAIAAEHNQRRVKINSELVARLKVVAGLEQLVRDGFISIDKPLALRLSSPMSVSVTEKGMAAAISASSN
jgi:hypothetical protein